MLGGARVRFSKRLDLMEESLMSEATLAESESKSSYDSALLNGREDGLRLRIPAVWKRKYKGRQVKYIHIYTHASIFKIK